MKTFLLRLEDEIHTSLKVQAAMDGKSMQDLIREILDSYMDR